MKSFVVLALAVLAPAALAQHQTFAVTFSWAGSSAMVGTEGSKLVVLESGEKRRD